MIYIIVFMKLTQGGEENMSNQDVMNVLKSLTLEDIVKLVINDEKKNGVNEDKQEIIESSKEIYNIEELIEKYPFFTRYNINKAIEEDKFPVFYIGRKKFFDKDEIEAWLSQKSISKANNKKDKFKI